MKKISRFYLKHYNISGGLCILIYESLCHKSSNDLNINSEAIESLSM